MHLVGDAFVNGLPLQRVRMLCPDSGSSARSSAKQINSLMAASHNARDTERVQHRRERDAEGRSARITVARDRSCHANRLNALQRQWGQRRRDGLETPGCQGEEEHWNNSKEDVPRSADVKGRRQP